MDINDINSWIEEIHRNKHNMIPVVKLAISKPIEALLETSNLTNDFPTSLLPVIKSKKNEADDIMSYLSSIGNTKAKKENEVVVQEVVVQLEKQIEFVVNSIIPKIKEFSLFFQQFRDKDFYFAKTDGGQRVLGLVQKAPSRCEMSCQGLSKLKIDSPISSPHNKPFRLIEVVEEVFDELDVDVKYNCPDRDILVSINKAGFETEVLQNIAENIKRHAFPFAEYVNKLLSDKVVEIQITKDDNKVLIRVSNNGNPFKGNADNLFNSGYHSGKYGRTGFGLASAKQFMQKIGGDIQFSPANNYQVSFLITIPN